MAQIYDHWMAFDFGTQRIGIAVGQAKQRPLTLLMPAMVFPTGNS